jgi:imidazolonepropionase-like amidohydrolase
MKSFCLSVFTLVLFSSFTFAQERADLGPTLQPFVAVNAPVVALTHVRLIDGTGAPVRNDQTIILQGNRIQTVGPDEAVAIPPGAEVIDLAGHTVIPGLVSLHEHTWFGGIKNSTPMPATATASLALGVTTAMTAGTPFPYDELNIKRMVDAGMSPGPRLHISGPYLVGGEPRNGSSRVLSTYEDVVRVVDYWAGEGATWLKFMGQGSREMLGAVVRQAHSRGLKVSGHLCSVTFTEAAALGIDALQHGFITNSDYVPDKQPDICPPDNMRVQADVDVESALVQRSIEEIVASGAAAVSTLGVYETFTPERARLDPRAMELLTPETRREVEANHATIKASEFSFVVPPRLIENMMQWERAFVAAGGLLGAGSDPWGTGYLPGFGNLRNYEMLLEAGFTAEESVEILTLNGARILGEATRLGSVSEGKLADLVVIRGDPVATPSDIYEVVTVFKDGYGYDSHRLLEDAAGKIGN